MAGPSCVTPAASQAGGLPPRDASQPARQGPTDPDVLAFLTLYSQSRADAGCPPIQWDDRLARVAEAHSMDMATRGFFGHTNPDGHSPFDRMRERGIAFVAGAENIARAEGARSIHDGWLASTGHRENMLDCSFTHHGVGRSGLHWTHLFVERREDAREPDTQVHARPRNASMDSRHVATG